MLHLALVHIDLAAFLSIVGRFHTVAAVVGEAAAHVLHSLDLGVTGGSSSG